MGVPLTQHTPFSIQIITPTPTKTCDLTNFLARTAATIARSERLPTSLTGVDVVMLTETREVSAETWSRLDRFVSAGGGVYAIADTQTASLPSFFGAKPCELGPTGEQRILFTKRDDALGVRLPDSFYVHGQFQPLAKQDDRTDVVLYADWRYEHQPMLTLRNHGNGMAVATTIRDRRSPTFQQITYRILRQLAGFEHPAKTLNVGLLGYAPSVGLLHGTGSAQTQGMALRMACDLNESRLAVAREAFPDLHVTVDSAEMRDSPDIDVVIIATPPSSHAALAMQMLDGGKHVICEKPLALSVKQTEQMRELAAKHNRHLSCHQNRRWDSDYRAIRRAISDKLLGDVFYVETFVGGYGHPCGFWHSHDVVSGGTTFDWGAHYLDWMLDLMPGQISGVIGTRQNRLWHDITNADRERIQLRFANGAEAEFTHCDLAHLPKPKWYIVGTDGTIVGDWRKVDSYEVDPVVYYKKHEIPSAELGADLTLRKVDEYGGLYERTLPEPKRKPFPFHANLADHLLLGEPIEVEVDHSARVVAVMEAAKISAENGGRIEQVEI